MQATIEKTYEEIKQMRDKILYYCERHALDFSMIKNHICCPLCLKEYQIQTIQSVTIPFNELVNFDENKILSGIQVNSLSSLQFTSANKPD